MTHLTETSSNYSTDRNDCPERPFDTTFYIATQRRLDADSDWLLQYSTSRLHVDWRRPTTTAARYCYAQHYILGPSYLYM